VSGQSALILARESLADRALEGLVRANRYAATTPMQVAAPVVPLRSNPDPKGEQVDQLLFGEIFEVLEANGGYAWGQARRDGYVGYVDCTSLSEDVGEVTHWVGVLRAFAYAEPAIRSPATGPISLNALVMAVEESGPFTLARGLGWLPSAHIVPIGRTFVEPAAVVERFLGTPYLWGGRDSIGLDCSGLIQQALYACGRGCPRDTGLQQGLGAPAPRNALSRGDLVFWRGHVGMMIDSERLAHANAHHMAVAIEPLAGAVRRIAQSGGGRPTAYRRI
jgi:hypothetical protein